uniref:Uncharacterized protein n=1 Tax=Globodera rostochiensis TaxID=31243 RepID=A0A914GSC0_GLORO
MSGSSSNTEKKDKFTEFSEHAHHWTLKQDNELKNALQNTVSGMFDSIQHFERVGAALESEMDLFETRFENIRNRIGCLKMERLVKEQVDDISFDLLCGRRHKTMYREQPPNISREEFERRTINTISNAIHRGFELFNAVQDDHPQRNLQSSSGLDPSDPSSSSSLGMPPSKSMDGANLGELPPIIGTPEFYAALRRANEAKTESATAKAVKELSSMSPPTTMTTTKLEEEDIASISSGRSAPPQDPVVVVAELSPTAATISTGGGGNAGHSLRTALMEEIVERAQRKDDSTKTEEEEKKQRIGVTQRVREEKLRTEEEKRKKMPRAEEKQGTEQRRHVDESGEKQKGLRIRNAEQRQRTEGERERIGGETEEHQKSSEGQQKGFQIQKPVGGNPSATANGTPKRMGGRHVKKSLFSSSSEDGDNDEEELFKNSTKSLRPVVGRHIQRQTLANDSSSSPSTNDRSLSQRPLSAHPISPSGDGQLPPARPVRKTESAVISSNEELGPASVKNRIAQIGAQIPLGQRADGGRREEGHRHGDGGGQISEPTPAITKTIVPLPTEALKTRVKGPSARRAPSQRIVGGRPPAPSSSSVVEPTEAVTEASSARLTPKPALKKGLESPQQRQKNEEEKESPSSRTANLWADDSMKRALERMSKDYVDEEADHQQTSRIKPPPVPATKAQGPKTAAKAVPPPVKPKKTRSSIFSSSSSDDDLGFAKVMGSTPLPGTKEVPKATAVPSNQQQNKQQQPPFSYKKTTTSVKARKGLFDDSESDF